MSYYCKLTDDQIHLVVGVLEQEVIRLKGKSGTELRQSLLADSINVLRLQIGRLDD